MQLYCTVLYCTVLYCTVLYCIVQALVANSTNSYAEIASRLANDREFAYKIRVRLLEAVDGKAGLDGSRGGGGGGGDGQGEREEAGGREGDDGVEIDLDRLGDLLPAIRKRNRAKHNKFQSVNVMKITYYLIILL